MTLAALTCIIRSMTPPVVTKTEALTVDELAAAFRTRTGGARARAAEALGAMGGGAATAASALAEGLDDPEWHVRSAAARALGAIHVRTPAIVARLVHVALSDPQMWPRSSATWALTELDRLGDPVAEAIVTGGFLHEDEHVRLRAARVLAKLGPRAVPAVDALVTAIGDRSGAIREASARTLGAIGAGAVAALPVLLVRLEDHDPRVRCAAVSAAAAIGLSGDSGLAEITARLGDHDPEVRAMASAGLARMGHISVAAVPVLISLLTDEDVSVRARAAEALGVLASSGDTPGANGPDARTRSEVAVGALIAQLADDAWIVRDVVGESLGRLDRVGVPIAPTLLGAIRSRSAPMRLESLRVLANLDDPRDEGRAPPRGLLGNDGELRSVLVSTALHDPLTGIRHQAIRALSKHPRALAELGSALGDARPRVRRRAAKALHPFDKTVGSLVRELDHALHDPSASVRRAVVELLSGVGNPAASCMPRLVRRQFEDTSVARAANETLKALALSTAEDDLFAPLWRAGVAFDKPLPTANLAALDEAVQRLIGQGLSPEVLARFAQDADAHAAWLGRFPSARHDRADIRDRAWRIAYLCRAIQMRGAPPPEERSPRSADFAQGFLRTLNALVDETGEKVLEGLVFTALEWSDDTRSARVLYTTPRAVTNIERRAIRNALERASAHFRGELLQALKFEVAPKLRFAPDLRA